MGNFISFSVSEKERQRAYLASKATIDLDPRGPGDGAMIIMFLIIYGFDLFAVLFMLWNRKYPPLKSKNPFIMTLVMVCAWIWFASELAANGHIPLAGTIMTNCKAFGVWLRVLLGVCSVSYLIALRTYGLYRVFRLGKPFRGPGFYLPFVLHIICVLLFGIVSQVISPRLTIQYVESLDVCNYYSGFKASVFALLWVTWILVAFMLWKIRNIKSSFNESREITVACFIVFSVLVFSTVMHYTHPRFALDVQLRIATTTLNHIALNSVWWLIMAKPLYMCLFHKKKYLRKWMHKLSQDGLQQAYDVDSRGTSGMVALGSYNTSISILINEKGNGHNVGSFYAMNESSVQGHVSNWAISDHRHTGLAVPLKNALDIQKPMHNQGTLSTSGVKLSCRDKVVLSSFNGLHTSIGNPIISSALNSHNSAPKAYPVSPRLVPESQRVYKPFVFPDPAHIAPLSLMDAQRRNLDKYGSKERNL